MPNSSYETEKKKKVKVYLLSSLLSLQSNLASWADETDSVTKVLSAQA